MKRSVMCLRSSPAVIGILLALLAPAQGALAQQGANPLPPDGSAFGMTLAEWSAAWWQWMLSIPKESNPMLDTTGQFSGVGQRMPVWFLGSTFGGSATRTCSIPAGQAILFPISASVAWEGDAPSEAGWRELAKRDQDAVTVLEAKVDGVPIPDLKRYRVVSPVFTITFPPGNPFNVTVQAGSNLPLRAAADGYYIFLSPLPAGQHVIQIRNELPLSDGSVFKADVTYNLTVRAP